MRKIKNAIKWVSRRMSMNTYWLPTGTFPTAEASSKD